MMPEELEPPHRTVEIREGSVAGTVTPSATPAPAAPPPGAVNFMTGVPTDSGGAGGAVPTPDATQGD